MGEEAGTEAVIPEGDYSQEGVSQAPAEPTAPQQSSADGHPAYQEIYDFLPEGFHGPIKERLERWDKGVQEKFQQVHSTYEPYKPFVENEISPQDLHAAYNFYQMANADPQGFIRQMQEFFAGEEGEQEQGLGNDEEEEEGFETEPAIDISKHPRFAQLEQQQAQIAEYLENEVQKKAAEEADAQVDTWLGGIKEKYGPDIDLDYVMQKALLEGNKTGNFEAALENAAKSFVDLRTRLLSSPRPSQGAPTVVPSRGGGVPMAQNPTELTGADRRAYVAQRLQEMLKD